MHWITNVSRGQRFVFGRRPDVQGACSSEVILFRPPFVIFDLMSDSESISHEDFVRKFRSDDLVVLIDKDRAGELASKSPFSNLQTKLTYLFWSWGPLVLVLFSMVTFFLTSWVYAVVLLITGGVVLTVIREVSTRFVLQNMLKDENFWSSVVEHGGARITDKNHNYYQPKGSI